MTPEEFAADVEWTRRMAELEDGAGGILAAGLTVAARKFPVPKTDGLSSEEAEAVLARWRADVHAYLNARDSNGTPPAPVINPTRDRV